jgi:hypothetical protein
VYLADSQNHAIRRMALPKWLLQAPDAVHAGNWLHVGS